MRLTILGGGGFRVPLIHRALLDDPDSPITELALYDVDSTRLARISEVLTDQSTLLDRPGPQVSTHTDLVAAVRGASFIFSAIRVGGLQGRVCDERAALDLDVLGQETTGAGGICYGLRTLPVAMAIAEAVRTHAPDAWLINFTNPAGMVTEAMSEVLGSRVIGICDSPVGLFNRAARMLNIDPATATFDYAGLNHLGWLRRIMVGDRDLLPDLLASDALLLGTEEGRLFGPEWLRSLGAIPNEYLWYWYYTSDAIKAIKEATETRGEYLLEQQSSFYGRDRVSLSDWDFTRRAREETYMADSRAASDAGERDEEDLQGGGYDRLALRLMHAIASNEPTTLVLNVPNGGTLAGLDAQAIVEIPCVVDGNGPRPIPAQPLASYAQGMVMTVKDVERTTIAAARSGSRRMAVKALALHPLVDSVNHARAILDTQLGELPDLQRVLTAH